MANNYVQDGNTATWTNGTGSDVSANAIVEVGGGLIGVAIDDIADTEDGEILMTGVFEVTKTAGNAWVQGENVIWDTSAAEFDHSGATPATGDISGNAVAWRAADSADVIGYVKINVAIGTVT